MSAATVDHTDFPADHPQRATHIWFVGGDQNTDQGHTADDSHTLVALVGTSSTQGSKLCGPQAETALGGHHFPDGHHVIDTQRDLAVGGRSSLRSQKPIDDHDANAPGGTTLPAGGAKVVATPRRAVRPLLDPLLTLASITLDDLEELRIAQENRYRSLTQSGTSENGLEWGFGLDDRDPNVAAAGAIVDQIKAMEKTATLNLQKLMRKHPLGPWVKAQKGIGDKQAARLLGVIGDPYWHAAEDSPRTVSELWAYSGLKPGQKRQKGQKSNWSTEAKTRAYLIAEATMKQLDKQCKTETGIAEHVEGCGCSVYRRVYDARREHTAEREHDTECVRCGPSGKPAQPGTPWSKAHQMADALRVVSKEILKNLWRESRRIHGEDAQ